MSPATPAASETPKKTEDKTDSFFEMALSKPAEKKVLSPEEEKPLSPEEKKALSIEKEKFEKLRATSFFNDWADTEIEKVKKLENEFINDMKVNIKINQAAYHDSDISISQYKTKLKRDPSNAEIQNKLKSELKVRDSLFQRIKKSKAAIYDAQFWRIKKIREIRDLRTWAKIGDYDTYIKIKNYKSRYPLHLEPKR